MVAITTKLGCPRGAGFICMRGRDASFSSQTNIATYYCATSSCNSACGALGGLVAPVLPHAKLLEMDEGLPGACDGSDAYPRHVRHHVPDSLTKGAYRTGPRPLTHRYSYSYGTCPLGRTVSSHRISVCLACPARK